MKRFKNGELLQRQPEGSQPPPTITKRIRDPLLEHRAWGTSVRRSATVCAFIRKEEIGWQAPFNCVFHRRRDGNIAVPLCRTARTR
ncbi:hypothetical protein V9L00_17560 [Pseudoxanthomonas sp. CCNWLW206]